jgi:hypothetical protein
MAVVPRRRSLIGRTGANSRTGDRVASGAGSDGPWTDETDDQTTEPPVTTQGFSSGGFGDLGDLEVVERPVPGGGFDSAHQGHDSFAMEDVSEEVLLDPRLNQRAEPATELIDRDAFAALSATEADDEVITVGPSPAGGVPEDTPEITPLSIPLRKDGSRVEFDPADRQTLVPLNGAAEAVPSRSRSRAWPVVPPAPAGDDDTGGLLESTDQRSARVPPTEATGPQETQFLRVAPIPASPAASPLPGIARPPRPRAHARSPNSDPSTEVIERGDDLFDALAEATVPTTLPTLEEVEQLAFHPHHPVDHGHDELSLPPPLGGFERSGEQSSSRDTADALALPPPEPGDEDSAPISLEPFSQLAGRPLPMEHTLPIPSAQALSAPPLPPWAGQPLPASRGPEADPPPAAVVPQTVRTPSGVVSRPASSTPTALLDAAPAETHDAHDLDLDLDLDLVGGPHPRDVVGGARAAGDPSVPAVPPMVGLLALIGSGGLLAAVVVGAVVLVALVVLFVAWDSAPDEPVEVPLPPIELPAPGSVDDHRRRAPIEEPEPEPERERRSGARAPAPPVPEVEPEPIPEPVAPVPTPAPPPPPADLEPDDEDDEKKRGLFRKKK